VHAAAGGVGIAAVQVCCCLLELCTFSLNISLAQIGKALGARVIGTVGSNDKIDVVKRAGADEVVSSPTPNFISHLISPPSLQ